MVLLLTPPLYMLGVQGVGCPGNGPLGTVANEIYLYAFYPIAIWAMRRFSFLGLFMFAAVSFCAQALIRGWLMPSKTFTANLLEFLAYWLLGMATVEWNARQPAQPRKWTAGILVAVSVTLFLVLSHRVHVKGFYIVTMPIAAIASAAIITLATRFEASTAGLLQKALIPLSRLGERSYSLYAIHTPIIAISFFFIDRIATRSSITPADRWLSLIAVIIATEVLYRFVERPSHNLSRRLARSPAAPDGPVAAPAIG